MKFEKTVNRIRIELQETFAAVDLWFDVEPQVRAYLPQAGRWSIDLILEHIALTNHFLMLTLEKQISKAEKRAAQMPIPDGESDLDLLNPIGERGSFGWERPDHMEPAGKSTSEEVRRQLTAQRDCCLQSIERIKDGVGSLVLTTMTVNGLGKIDIYQWVYFLVQHAKRHLQQMQAIQLEQES